MKTAGQEVTTDRMAQDCAQFRVTCRDTIALGPSAWPSSCPPLVTGKHRLHQGFRPDQVLVREIITVTFADNTKEKRVSACIDGADDLVLTTAFADAAALLLTFPDVDALERSEDAGQVGIARVAVASIINRIDWSKIRGGIDLVLGLSVKKSVMERVTTPEGFCFGDIRQIEVMAQIIFLGQMVPAWEPDWLKSTGGDHQ